MIAGKSRQHPDHIIKPQKKRGIPLLKTGVIYGANASGKSNFVKAMKFARDIILTGTEKFEEIPVKPYKLDTDQFKKPSSFEFEFTTQTKYYAYGFTLNADEVLEEWLFEVDKEKEKPLFESKREGDNHKYNFSGIKFKNQEEKDFLEFVAKGTRKNQLILTECIERNVGEQLTKDKRLFAVYQWFKEVLTIITPDTKYGNLEMHFHHNENWAETFKNYLNEFDTGISDIILKEVDFKNDLWQVPDKIKQHILNKQEGNFELVVGGPENMRFLIQKNKDSGLHAYKLMTKHKKEGESDYELFELNEESDGTQRLMDLIPGLMDMKSQSRVYVIDELDRSIHPNVSRQLIELFLSKEKINNSQIIVTTHEAELLDQNLLRKDEIWFVEKNKNGASELYSLEEFKPRYDKDIRKGYLLGRFGGIPELK